MYMKAEQIPVENKCEVRTVWGRITDKLEHKYGFCDNEQMIWKTTKIYTGLKIPPAPKMSVPKFPSSRLQELMPSDCCIPVTELQNMTKYIKSSGQNLVVHIFTVFKTIISIQCVQNLDQIFKTSCIVLLINTLQR